MKSLIKGRKVTVSISVKADEIGTCGFRHDEGRERKNDEVYKGLDINAGVGIELAESDGDVDLREISDLLHYSIKEQVRDQVKECLDKRYYNQSDYEKEVRRNTSE